MEPHGILTAIANNDEIAIKIWYGSQETYDAIPKKWEDFDRNEPLRFPGTPLSRGFDESKPVEELDITDMKESAAFRGGECLSESMTKGDMYTPLHVGQDTDFTVKMECDGSEMEKQYGVKFSIN